MLFDLLRVAADVSEEPMKGPRDPTVRGSRLQSVGSARVGVGSQIDEKPVAQSEVTARTGRKA
jgi:hypothetical protein